MILLKEEVVQNIIFRTIYYQTVVRRCKELQKPIYTNSFYIIEIMNNGISV